MDGRDALRLRLGFPSLRGWGLFLALGTALAPACGGRAVGLPTSSKGAEGAGDASNLSTDIGQGGDATSQGGSTGSGARSSAGGTVGQGANGGKAPGSGGKTPSGGAGGKTPSGGAGGKAGSAGNVGFGGAGSPCPPNSLKRPDGLCYCQPATLSACVDGCYDPTQDADHCGDCSIKCQPMAACADAKCGAVPDSLVPSAPGCSGVHLALAGGTVYFTDTAHGTVSSAPAAGGAARVLLQNQAKPTQIVATSSALFWLASGARSVMTASLSGTAAQTVTTSTSDAINDFVLSADGQTLYYSAGTALYRTTTAPGGAVVEVGREESGIPHGLALSGEQLAFPTDVNGDVDVMTFFDDEHGPAICASPDSGIVNANCMRMGRSQGDLLLDTIFIVDSKAYWANGNSVVSSSVTPTGFNDTIAQTTNPLAMKITAFTINGAQLYFADETGFVYQAPLAVNAASKAIARGQNPVVSMVSDAARLYWGTSDCRVLSMAIK